jgi:hypothetical protein
MKTYAIHREGRERVELLVQVYDEGEALNEFADYMERRDVPAFYHQDGTGKGYILADGERYFARHTPEIGC